MSETADILAAFDTLCSEGRRAALATVIAVQGSAYRRPGARMLIAEDGRTWGGISGGCLEQDVARRGRGVIATERPIIALYDTREDEPDDGPATGCHGAIEIFIEPLSPAHRGPLPCLRRVMIDRRDATMVTVVRASAGSGVVVGEHFTLDDAATALPMLSDVCRLGVASEAQFEEAVSFRKTVRLGTGAGFADVFIEHFVPPQSLIIFGGPDVAPLVAMARSLGWHVTVVASRPAIHAQQQFRDADVILINPAENPTAGILIDEQSAVVLMTHNFPRDLGILRSMPIRPKYLGILGPRSRTDRLLAELGNSAIADDLYAPIGLILGAETAAEIALAIAAEIQAVIRGMPARFLRDHAGPIHGQSKFITSAKYGGAAFA